MNWMKELNDYMTREGLSQADMARLFGVELQRYNNWIYRDSLPKTFIDKARELVGDDADTPYFGQMREIMSMLDEGEQEKLVAQAALYALKLKNGHTQ